VTVPKLTACGDVCEIWIGTPETSANQQLIEKITNYSGEKDCLVPLSLKRSPKQWSDIQLHAIGTRVLHVAAMDCEIRNDPEAVNTWSQNYTVSTAYPG
jgi:hypothetical protein